MAPVAMETLYNDWPHQTGPDEPLCEVNCVKVQVYSAQNTGLIVAMHVGEDKTISGTAAQIQHP